MHTAVLSSVKIYMFVSYWQDKNADQMVKNYVDTIIGYQEWVLQCKKAYGDDWELIIIRSL